MTHATDIVGYTYAADTYCPGCIVDQLPTGDGEQYDGWALAEGAAPMTAEDNLTEIAAAFGIDRMDEASYDSGDFPKVIFASQVEDEDTDRCGECGDGLLGTPGYILTARAWGRDAAQCAATWVELSEGDARSILKDVDPAVLDKFREPNLSGEFADDPTPTSLARDILGADWEDEYGEAAGDVVGEIADAWEEPRRSGSWSACTSWRTTSSTEPLSTGRRAPEPPRRRVPTPPSERTGGRRVRSDASPPPLTTSCPQLDTPRGQAATVPGAARDRACARAPSGWPRPP